MTGMKRAASDMEYVLVLVGFAVSTQHWVLCALYFAALIFYLQQGIIGCIKGLLILTTRGLLSSAVSRGLTGVVQMEKWAMIFLFSIMILYFLGFRRESSICKKLRVYVGVFTLYIILVSFITSSYPTVSAFKAISYAIPFCAVTCGVSETNSQVDWIEFLHRLLTPTIVLCIVLIPFNQFRIVNETFQGAINHPNLMGIFAAIYIGISIFGLSREHGLRKIISILLIAASFYMIYLTRSRTGMFSAIAMLVIHLASLRGMRMFTSIVLVLTVLIVTVFYFQTHPEVYSATMDEVNSYVYKRDEEDILDSRHEQIDSSMEKYKAHPLLGSGFAVPYKEGVINSSFTMDLTYEAGNLVIAVLGDCGILGSILFWWYILYMFIHTNHRKWVLFFLPIVISFGEMAFFATNNIAIYYYLIFGICLGREEGA